MSDLHELTAAEQLRALAQRQVTSTDLTRHYLERIAALDTGLGAFVTVTADLAMHEAALADARLDGGEWAPLLGLPLGIKDLFPTAGVRTTLGSAAMEHYVPAQDSWTVALLRGAGAVLLGKTNTPELGPTCYTDNDVTDHPAVTPYDRARYASGSSGGAAAAVAAGLLPVAHASDGAGSIRTPAATCHLVGIKPSRGLVSSAPTSSFLAAGTEGPIARTVEDAALLLDVMARPAPADLYGWVTALPFTSAISRGPGQLRIAAWTGTGLPDVDAHPEAVAAVQLATVRLRALGHDVQEIAIPVEYDAAVIAALRAWFAATVGATVAAAFPTSGNHLLRPYTRYLVEQCATLSASDLVNAQSVLARYASSYLAALAPFDVALTPTTSGPPVPVGHYSSRGVQGEADLMLAWSCYTPWANLTGQPAASLPSHLDSDGLPYSVQLVGRPRHDAQLLALAAQLERAAPWHTVHPPCWDQ